MQENMNMKIAYAILAAFTTLVLAVMLIGTDTIAQPVIYCNLNGNYYYQANLATDSNNCGMCGLICPASTPCKAGKCVDSVCSSAKRRLIRVNQNLTDTNAFHTIKAAVNAANPCDTIYVSSGTYKENIKIDKSLAIKGSGEAQTKVDGGQAGCVFEIGSANPGIKVTLSEIRIQNGLTANNGGGILNSGTLTVSRCNITKNTAKEGGAVSIVPTQPAL
jgi:hypothetical protein